MKNIFALSIAFLYASAAFAEADLNPNIFNTPATSSTTATRETTPVKTGTSAGVPVMTGSINPGSQTGKDSQKSGSGSNAGVGAALMAAGAAMMASPPTVAPGVALMAMGMLAMMQSKEDSGAADQSAATGMASNVNDGKTGTVPVDPSGTSAFADAKIKEGQAKLAEAGYKLTNKGLVAPDGSVTPTSAFNSPSSMAASGMSPSSIAAVQGALSDAQGGAMNGARVSGVGIASGGGGNGGVTEGDSNGSSASDSGHSNPFGLGADQKRSLVAGKTVMFDGEPIGVRGQNIFEMVHTAYQKKRDGKHFIETESDVSTRMPASIKPRSR